MNFSSDQIDHAGETPIAVEAFYRYGYAAARMLAIRAPFAMGADGAEIIGRAVEADGRRLRSSSRLRARSPDRSIGASRLGSNCASADAREKSAA